MICFQKLNHMRVGCWRHVGVVRTMLQEYWLTGLVSDEKRLARTKINKFAAGRTDMNNSVDAACSLSS